MDLNVFLNAISFIRYNGYFIMFILMFLEGPLVTYVSAFAASSGLFNVYSVFILSVLGNLLADILYFSIGRFATKTFLDKYISKKGNLEKVKHLLDNHAGKYLAMVKIIPPLPSAGLIFAGMSNMSFRKFLFYALLIGIPYSLFFTLAGFYSGLAFATVFKYFWLASAFIGLIIALVVLFSLYLRKISNKLLK